MKVLKFLMERNSINALHGQVTVGTLILQACFFHPLCLQDVFVNMLVYDLVKN
jgi:predicted Kef-type K+ transport protein